jgi:hypothetical protein
VVVEDGVEVVDEGRVVDRQQMFQLEWQEVEVVGEVRNVREPACVHSFLVVVIVRVEL